MSKRGSGSSARAGGDSTMKSFGGDLPELQGTPKQIAYAQDIRDGWIKNTFEGYQKEYAERLQKLETQKNRIILEILREENIMNDISNI